MFKYLHICWSQIQQNVSKNNCNHFKCCGSRYTQPQVVENFNSFSNQIRYVTVIGKMFFSLSNYSIWEMWVFHLWNFFTWFEDVNCASNFSFNPLTANLFNMNFHPLKSCVSLTRSTTSSEWKLFRFDKTEVNIFKSCWLMLRFIK